jgi:two-component system sensor histidine kinase/response regulator
MSLRNCMVLIIDDEAAIRDGCRQALEKSGYQVLTAECGEEGLRLAREKTPAIAFIDLKMPGMSGLEITASLAREVPDVVPVIITGFASIPSAVEAIQKGAYDYIPKPFSADQLRLIARRALDHHSLKVETNQLRADKERMEKNFITFVSHEMRSPLVVIRQYLEALRTMAADGLAPEAEEVLNRCRSRVQDLETMIERWLDISRIEEGSFVRMKQRVDLPQVIEQSVEEMACLCGEKRIILETDVDQEFPDFIGDKESLVRVFCNLIGNAIKYTPGGGRIRITARKDKVEEHHVTVLISDTGSGIPPEKLPFVFEPFFRVRGKEEPERGSGLGLTFCKKIMGAHNGEIGATSKEGRGTTFFLKFPLVR